MQIDKEMNDVDKSLISATRIHESVYLITTFRSDDKSQVSYITPIKFYGIGSRACIHNTSFST